MPRPWLSLYVLALFIKAASSQTCSNDTCSTFFNRTCSVNDDCTGPCLVNYTDFGNRTESCFAISDITWERFSQRFDPEFVDDLTIAERLELVIKVAIFISQFNANNPNVTLALNKFSADSPEDAKALRGYRNVDGVEDMLEPQEVPLLVGSDTSSDGLLPTKRDWVEMGAVTSMKDQGRCGCCWAISLCGAIEGAAAINSDFTYLQSVSFQQFASCDKENFGCNGGNIVVGMVYAAETNERGGIARLNDYPFSDGNGDTTEECNLEPDRAVDPNDGRVIVTFTDGRDFDERLERMKYTLSFQPISMVLKSTCNLFSNYRSGIVTDDEDCRCEVVDCIDHAVLLVGYNDEDDIPYWKIKNSWGTGWGEDGYMRIAQASYGRRWGLFGMLSQGVVALDVQNVTAQVYDEPQTSNNLTGWQIALIAVAGFLVAVLCCCCIMTAAKKK